MIIRRQLYISEKASETNLRDLNEFRGWGWKRIRDPQNPAYEIQYQNASAEAAIIETHRLLALGA